MLWSKSSTLFEKFYYLILLSFIAFPVVDYLLRNVIPIPLMASLLDELLLILGLALVGLRLLFGEPGNGNPLTKTILSVMLIGIAYLVLDLTSLAINFEGFRAIFQYMFVFFIAFYLNDRPENTKKLLAVAVVIGTFFALHGIYQYVAKVPMPGRWVDAGESGATRAFSILGSPNALGSQLAMLIPIAFGLFIDEKNRLRKLLWISAVGVMGICLIFTGSRGAWLALVGVIAILGILYDRRILIAGIIIALIATLFVPYVNQRITYLFSAEYMMKSAQSGRISRWFEAYDQMRNNPLFGSGLGHFGGAVAKRHYNTIYVDNYYMKTIAEIGLLGITAFLWLILRTLKEGYSAMKRSSTGYKFMAAGMFGGLLAIVLHNGVENIFEIPYLNMYFWLIAGLLLALPVNLSKTGGGTK